MKTTFTPSPYPLVPLSPCHLVIVLLTLALPSLADAHPVPRRAHDRTITVELTADAVVVYYRLEVDEFTVVYVDLPAVDDKVNLKKLGSPREFYEAYTRVYAPILAEHLDARLDGKELTFACVKHGYRLTDDDGKPLDHLRCDFVFKAPWQPDLIPSFQRDSVSDKYAFTFKEDAFLEEPGLIRLELTSKPPVEVVSKSVADRALQERQTRDLKPGEEAKLRQASASFRVGVDLTLRVRELPHAEREAYDAGDEGGDRHSLLELLLDPKRGFWMLLLLSAGFGAVHALTPGHGKTLVAAYLVGERGTVWHACLLGLVTTLTHTGAVLALATGLRFWFPQTMPADVQSSLRLVGGLLIAGMGFWLFLRRITGQADHIHLPGHGHHHHHGDEHQHHDHGHAGHVHDEQGHVHPLPASSGVTAWGLIVLGISGGIVPCWDAIAMLLFAISAQRLWLALPLLLAFSAGLAAVLIAIGIAVVYLKDLSGSRWGTSRVFQALPLLSALLITAMGLWLCVNRT